MTIPDEVLATRLNTIEGDYISLRELINQTSDQPIDHAECHGFISEDEDDFHSIGFTAWTKDYVLSLVHTSSGYLLLKSDRNYNGSK